MDASHEEVSRKGEEMPIVSTLDTPTTVQNTEKSYRNQLPVYLILASLLLERVAFYSVAANLTVSLGDKSPLQWSDPNIIVAEFIFTGVSYFSSLVFAFVSDAKLGRAKTIILGFSVYTAGFILAILSTHPKTYRCLCKNPTTNNSLSTRAISQEPCAATILTTIVVIALGAGAVQSNMAVLGAEQIGKANRRSRYFDKYMVAVNIGSAAARLTFSFTLFGEMARYFYIVYVVASVALITAVILFLIGWRRYRCVKPYDSVITKCIPVIINAYRIRKQYSKNKNMILGVETNVSASNPVNSIHSFGEEKDLTGMNLERLKFLDYAKAINGGKFNDRIVDDVKSLRSALPVFGFFIPYFIVYDQVNSSFPLQGRHMNTSGDLRKVTWVSLTDPATIISKFVSSVISSLSIEFLCELVGILILHMFIYKYWDPQNKRISIATKIVIGMFFACIAMFFTGSIEIARQAGCNHNNGSNTSSLPVYAQIPQYMSMGVFEIFAMVASYEYAYYAAPRSARSLFMSLRFCLMGLFSSITAAGVYFFPNRSNSSSACPTDKSWQWSFYTYFYILGGLQLLFIFIFIKRQRRSRIIKLDFDS